MDGEDDSKDEYRINATYKKHERNSQLDIFPELVVRLDIASVQKLLKRKMTNEGRFWIEYEDIRKLDSAL
jgi:hypothetical protein